MWLEVLPLIPDEDKVSGLNFEKFFFRSHNYSTLRMKALGGKLHDLKNRYLSWRLFLGILDETETVDAWVRRMEALRRDYEEICKGLDRAARVAEDEHPLSTTASNPWNAQFEERQLRVIIKQDVDRTNQHLPMFKTARVKDILLRILFIWARRNPTISYHQGMNEIAGVLLYVATCEQASFPLDIENEAAELLHILNDPQEVEADVFWMFTAVMNLSIKELYKGRENVEEGEPLSGPKVQPVPKRRAASVLKRINDIHHVYLKFEDEQLYTALESSGVEPQLHLL